MSWNTIFDLYNETVIADAPYVAQALSFIKDQIETNTTQGLEYKFLFDIAAFSFLDNGNNVVTLTPKQIDRLRDQIQFTLRNLGIHALSPYFSPSNQYNLSFLPSTTLSIEWHVRDEREYMKQYY